MANEYIMFLGIDEITGEEREIKITKCNECPLWAVPNVQVRELEEGMGLKICCEISDEIELVVLTLDDLHKDVEIPDNCPCLFPLLEKD